MAVAVLTLTVRLWQGLCLDHAWQLPSSRTLGLPATLMWQPSEPRCHLSAAAAAAPVSAPLLWLPGGGLQPALAARELGLQSAASQLMQEELSSSWTNSCGGA